MARDAFEARVTYVWLGQSMDLTIRADSASELDRRVRELKRIIRSTDKDQGMAPAPVDKQEHAG